MKCPYNRKALVQVYQKTNITNDETFINNGEQYILRENYELMQCFKGECGVWYNGKCNYNQGSNG